MPNVAVRHARWRAGVDPQDVLEVGLVPENSVVCSQLTYRATELAHTRSRGTANGLDTGLRLERETGEQRDVDRIDRRHTIERERDIRPTSRFTGSPGRRSCG